MSSGRGLFLNASNYEPTERLVRYATWSPGCIAFATNPEWYGNAHPEYCAGQYSLADPSDFGTWADVDMWYKNNTRAEWFDKLCHVGNNRH